MITESPTLAAPNMSAHVFVTLVDPLKVNMKDILLGDKMDGFRVAGLKINRGRRWKQWHVPAAVLRLERRSHK